MMTMKFRNTLQTILPLAALLLAGSPAQADEPIPCAEKSVSASAIVSTSDIEAFVQCAYEYVQEMGLEESARSFHEDERWNSGQFYVFVTNSASDGKYARTPIVFGADPVNRAGVPWGDLTDSFGTDLFDEWNRMRDIVDRGWTYYGFPNPDGLLTEPKATYLIQMEWDGVPAWIGSGIYRSDLPGTCSPAQVNAASVEAAQSMESLEEFVRCAALEAESKGWFARLLLESGPRWRAGSTYVFGLDMDGNQLFSGNPVMVSGERFTEWGRDPKMMFGGRDMAGMADTFGESHIYYRAIDPETGVMSRKAAFVKRVSAQGSPLLIGAGMYLPD